MYIEIKPNTKDGIIEVYDINKEIQILSSDELEGKTIKHVMFVGRRIVMQVE